MPCKDGRARLERTALSLFARRGPDRVSTRQIARRARLAEGTLYRHFRTKQELARHLFLEAAREPREDLERNLPRRAALDRLVPALVRGFFDFARRRPEAWEYLMGAHPPLRGLPPGVRLPKDVVVDALRRVGPGSGAAADLDPVLASSLLIAMITRAWFFLKEGLLRRDPDRLAAQVARAALRALGGGRAGEPLRSTRRVR